MKLSEVLMVYCRSLFKLNVLTFDLFDILFAVTSLPDFPVDEDNEPYDLENYGFMQITDTKIVFYCGGDWQSPMEVTIELVGNMPKITSTRLITDFGTYVQNEIPEEVAYELMELPKL